MVLAPKSFAAQITTHIKATPQIAYTPVQATQRNIQEAYVKVPVKSELSMPILDTVLFDMDGTLIDSLDSFVYSAKKTLEHFHVDGISDEWLRDQIKAPFDRIVGELAPSLQEGERRKAVALYVEIYDSEGYKLARPAPSAKRVLESLRSVGVKMAIVTSRSLLLRSIVPTLHECGLYHYFDTIVTSQDVPKPKPEPYQHSLALRRLNSQPAHAISVGDSPEDIIGARGAGTLTAAYTKGFHAIEELTKWSPDFILDDLARLPEIVGLHP